MATAVVFAGSFEPSIPNASRSRDLWASSRRWALDLPPDQHPRMSAPLIGREFRRPPGRRPLARSIDEADLADVPLQGLLGLERFAAGLADVLLVVVVGHTPTMASSGFNPR